MLEPTIPGWKAEMIGDDIAWMRFGPDGRLYAVNPEAYRQRAEVIFERKIADVYVEYQARLLKAGAMDFDDLLRNTVELFRTEPEVLEHYRRRFRHVLVDEYQDTNRVQNELVLQLAGEHHNICVVGDSDQCLLPGTPIYTQIGRAHV